MVLAELLGDRGERQAVLAGGGHRDRACIGDRAAALGASDVFRGDPKQRGRGVDRQLTDRGRPARGCGRHHLVDLHRQRGDQAPELLDVERGGQLRGRQGSAAMVGGAGRGRGGAELVLGHGRALFRVLGLAGCLVGEGSRCQRVSADSPPAAGLWLAGWPPG